MKKGFTMFFLIWAASILAQEGPPCFKDVASKFFRYDYVAQAFSLNDIDQSRWYYLYGYLQQKTPQVPSLLSAAAAQLNPNPLQPPYNAQKASEVLYSVLYSVFAQAMIDNQIVNQSDLRQMFAYVWKQQIPLLLGCFGPVPLLQQNVTH